MTNLHGSLDDLRPSEEAGAGTSSAATDKELDSTFSAKGTALLHGFYWMFPGFIGFYRVSLGFTRF